MLLASNNARISHVEGSNTATVRTRGISGEITNGEGRTNVNIDHKEE